MFELLTMWALVEVLGFVCLPLTFTVFHNLPDRGWAFSKTLGLAVFAFAVWFPLVCVHSLPFNWLFIAGVALILLILCLIGFVRMRRDIARMINQHFEYIIVAEVIFLVMVFLLGRIRSMGPDISTNEMFMDEGFITAIVRSPHLPPNDMWYAGEAINYYYYAHYTIALLAKFIGQAPSVAFNTGICIFFGLCASNLFGVTCNIVSWARHLRTRAQAPRDAEIALPSLFQNALYGFFAFVMALMFGNLASTRQWWISHDSGDLYGAWFGPSRVIKMETIDPNGVKQIVDATINEFPAFSFILSCFHAHVLTLAFTIAAIGVAFNLLLAQDKGLHVFGRGWRRLLTLFCSALMIGGLFVMNGWDYPTYLALALVCLGCQQWLVHHVRFSWTLLRNFLLAAVSLGLVSFLLFLPFYRSFVSPAQGFGLVSPEMRSMLSDELLIYGVFAFLFLSLLLASTLKRPLFSLLPLRAARTHRDNVEVPAVLETESVTASARLVNVSQTAEEMSEQDAATHSSVLLMEAESEDAVTHADNIPEPALHGHDEIPALAASESLEHDEEHVADSSVPALAPEQTRDDKQQKRSTAFGRLWLPFAAILYLICCMVALRFIPNSATLVVGCSLALIGAGLMIYHLRNQAHAFTLLLGATAFALVAFCEVVFLKDAYAGSVYARMNTVFKFYFQAWILLSVSGAAGLFFIFDTFRPLPALSLPRRWSQRLAVAGWSLVLLVGIAASLVYPITAPYERYAKQDPNTGKWAVTFSNNLDGMEYLKTCKPPKCPYETFGDYEAIRWLNANVQGDPVIIEAMGDDWLFSEQITTFTGLPTPMGWWYHEYQWRLAWFNDPIKNGEFQRRGPDIDAIYTNPDSNVVLSLMKRYNAQYIYVGQAERNKYPDSDLHRFAAFMQLVYTANGVDIYKVR